MLRAQKIRATRTAHAPEAHVRRQPLLHAALETHHRAERRMEGHKRAAVHRHRRRPTGHQVMIATAVIGVLVADGPHDGHLVHHLGQVRHLVAKLHARHVGLYRAELTANLLGRIRLGIKTLVMRRPAIQPHENAVQLFLNSFALSLCPQQIAKSQPRQSAEPHLQEISPA